MVRANGILYARGVTGKVQHWRAVSGTNGWNGAPVLEFVEITGGLPVDSHYGNVNPDRAFTAEMSDELIAPDAFTSKWKLSAVVACPERTFTLLMSLEFTDRVLFTSPTRNPIEAE